MNAHGIIAQKSSSIMKGKPLKIIFKKENKIMAKNIQFEQENNEETFQETTIVEKEAKKENSLISKVKGLKKWQKGLLIGGAAIGLGFAGTKLVKAIFGNKEVAQEVVENVVETTTEAVSEAAPF